jgi:hypothetical protein
MPVLRLYVSFMNYWTAVTQALTAICWLGWALVVPAAVFGEVAEVGLGVICGLGAGVQLAGITG